MNFTTTSLGDLLEDLDQYEDDDTLDIGATYSDEELREIEGERQYDMWKEDLE